MRDRNTSLIAFLLFGLIVALVVLAPALERSVFTSGRPFDETSTARNGSLESEPPQPLRTMDKVVAYGMVAFAIVLVILFLQRNASRSQQRTRRRNWMGVIFAAALAAAILLWVTTARPDAESEDEAPSEDIVTVGESAHSLDAAPVPEAPEYGQNPSSDEEGRSTAHLLQFFLAGIAAAVLVGLVLQARRHRARPDDPTPREELLTPIRSALRQLRSGRDPHGVVEECYSRMLRILATQTGIDPSTLTPQEFVHVLEKQGIADDSVGKLSHLFEVVHYGRRPDDGLADEALDCMTQIDQAFPSPTAEATE
jgi:predicted nucleic acid-binding Zn ribbon protein